jgi:Tfp pilus assembly protein PilF
MRLLRRARLVALLCALLAGISAGAGAQQTSQDSASMRQFRQALSLAQHNDPQGCMGILNRLLAQDPHFAPALKLKASLLEDAGRTADAAALYEEALQYAPSDPDLLSKSGMYALMAGKRDQAISLLARCVRLDPKDGDAQFYLAQAYHIDGQTDLALSAIRASASLEPRNGDILQKCGEYLLSAGKYPDALDCLVRAQKADATLPGIDYDLGAARYRLMDLAGAEKNLARAVEEHPNDFNALDLLATVEIHLAKWEEAGELLRRALALRPGDATALLGLGHCQVEGKEYTAAVDTLHRALHADPTQLQAHYFLSRAWAALGQSGEAQHEAVLHQLMMQRFTFMPFAAKQVDENAIVPQARALLQQHKEDEAIEVYRRHVSGSYVSPGDAWVFIGKLYLSLGDRSNGLRCLEHALDVDPHVRGAFTWEGVMALKDGDLTTAEARFQAELARDPNDQQAIAEMGELRYRQSRWAEAARLLNQSKTMSPELLYLLCDSDFHLGDTDNADLTAELTEAWGRSDAALMRNLLGLLRSNGQTRLADRLSQDLKP